MSKEEKVETPPPVAKSPGQMKLVIVGAVALFVALVGAQVAAPLINRVIGDGSHSAATEASVPTDEAGAEQPPAVVASPGPLGPAVYTALDPPFVVSFDVAGGARYLQLTVQAMARSDKTIAAVKQHSPAIRNAILFKLSGYELEVLTTQAGKEELRKSLLVAANEILAKNDIKTGIEELYFTSMVIQ